LSRTFSVLVVNPGATSTRIALFADEEPVFEETVRHSDGELDRYPTAWEQLDYRLETVRSALDRGGVRLHEVDAVAGRGGLLCPVEGGTYRVGTAMIEDLRRAPFGDHASNLGAPLALALARTAGAPAFVVDPVSVDEMADVARLSGHPLLPRRSLSHALSMKAAARKFSSSEGRTYEELNLVVAHLGSGISVSAHRRGRMVDVNNANDEGPFGADRAGGLPTSGLIDLCYSGRTRGEVVRMVLKRGGVAAYAGTRSVLEVEERARTGDVGAALTLDAMAYQIAKEIGAMAAVLEGGIDAVVLTGALAGSAWFCEKIIKRIAFLGRVEVLPGEEEMQALAAGVLRVLRGEEDPREYRPGEGREAL